MTVPPETVSVSQVRRRARQLLGEWGAEAYEWLLSQLLTEVSTNAVLHAATAFEVRLQLSGERLRCEVTDTSPKVPRPRRHHAPDATTGRGLTLVEELSTAWGVTRREGGKTVWFELSRGAAEDDGATTTSTGDGSARPSARPRRAGTRRTASRQVPRALACMRVAA